MDLSDALASIDPIKIAMIPSKITHRWRVIFRNDGQIKLHPLAPVSNQIISLTLPEIVYGAVLSDFAIRQLHLEIEDDILSAATKVINDFGVSREGFDVIVEILDGDETVVERIAFTSCQVVSMAHMSPLSYQINDKIRRHVVLAFTERKNEFCQVTSDVIIPG